MCLYYFTTNCNCVCTMNSVLRAESVSVKEVAEAYTFPEAGEVEGLAVSNGSFASISIPHQLLVDRAYGQNFSIFKKAMYIVHTWNENVHA